MKSVIAAVLVTTSLAAGSAFAQENAMGMDEGLSMLELSVSKEFTKLGINDVDPMSLDLNQLSLIKTVVASGDYSNNEKNKQIMTIIENN